MIWFTKKYKRRMAEVYEEKKEIAENVIAKLWEEYDRSKERMLSKPCPFLGGENCTDKCVHFAHGERGFLKFDDTIDDFDVIQRFPSCKLWRK